MRRINSHNIFLIDGIGAVLSASLLMFIGAFYEYIGLPNEILSLLALIAMIFGVYSLCCFMLLKKSYPIFLKLIIGANLVYSILTIGLVIFYKNSIKPLGIIYFVGEVLVILTIVYLELKTLKSNS